VLEVELRADRTRLRIDRGRVFAAPSALAAAFALLERAREDDALLAELAPETLASDCGDGAERLAYLRSLLEGLPEELLQRGLAQEEA
jgi:hypothetical protein